MAGLFSKPDRRSSEIIQHRLRDERRATTASRLTSKEFEGDEAPQATTTLSSADGFYANGGARPGDDRHLVAERTGTSVATKSEGFG